MANILNLITVGEKDIYVVDAIPSASLGTSAPIATIAMYDTGTAGLLYLKVGALDTDWEQISTTGTAGAVNSGVAGRLSLYPVTGNTVDDVYVQNSQNIDVAIEAQPSRSAAIEYRVPNPGNAITAADFILSEGAQTKNGDMTFNNNVIIQQNLTVNGSLTYLNSTNTTITDKLITLNQGGGAGSGGASGFEIAESIQATSTSAGANAGSIFTATATGAAGNGVVVTVTDSGGPGSVSVVEGVGTVAIDLNGNAPVSQATLAGAGLTLVTLNGVDLIAAEVFPATSGGSGAIAGYFKTAANRAGFEMKAPSVAFKNDLDLSNLSADRIQKFADTSGTFAMRPDGTPFVAKQIAYGQDANNLVSEAGFEYDPGSNVLSVPSITISGLGLGVVHSSAAGVLSSSAVVLTSEVSGILPIANGGTNSSTALNNNRVMISSAGSIVEHSALTQGSVIFANASGLPGQDNAKFFWDDANDRLGIGTNAPSVALHVVGNARISGLSAVPGIVHNDASGNLSSSAVSLTSEISGILPIANGGTNSSTALNNNRLMYSSSGAIVEYPALLPNQVYFGAASTGLPAQSVNLFWDISNSRLGIGTATPARSLDVNGSSLFQGALRLASSTATNANFELFQAQVSTTDATVTPIASVAVPSNSVVMLKAKVVGRRTGGSAGAAQDSAAYERTAKFKNIAGVVTIANLQSDYTSEDQAAFNATLVVNGTNAEIQVKGAANNNMDWTVTYEVISL